MERTDTRGRRLRTSRQPRGTQIYLQPRDLLWFEKLHEHGPLPTSYLHAFARHLGSDRTRALKRLADLYNEGRYLSRPRQQFETLDARYNQLVYDLDSRGRDALREWGVCEEHVPRPSGPWAHRLMVSCITASLELAAHESPGIRYIPEHAIWKRSEVGLGIPVRLKHPTLGAGQSGRLVPDALCGLEYQTRAGVGHILLAIEADRNTEPSRSSNSLRKSLQKSILYYREFIGRGLYQQHFDFEGPMLVLTVTTGARRMQGCIDLVTEVAPSGKNSFLCFHAEPAFGRPFKPPYPLPGLLNGPWARAGHAPLYINRPLGMAAGGVSEGRRRQCIGAKGP